MLGAVVFFMFGLLQIGQAWPWRSWPSVGVFAAALVLLAATEWVERHAAEPVMPGRLWRHPALAGSNLATTGMGIVMAAPNAYLPTFLQSVQGLGAIAAGWLADAPAALRAQMPDSVDEVIHALHRSGISKDAVAWLREAIALATRDLFIGMAMIAVLMLLVLLAVPRRFPEAPRESGQVPASAACACRRGSSRR